MFYCKWLRFVVMGFVLLSQTLLPINCSAGWLGDAFIDPSDGNLDMSNWILEREGLLPFPIIITEPAVGYGGGMALTYFHDNIGARKGSPPSVSAIAGGATENGTWFFGGGHMGIWKDDSIRYTGGIGTGLVKMDYYGKAGNHSGWQRAGVEFEAKALFIGQELQFRLFESKFFGGVGLTLVDSSTKFHFNREDINIDLPHREFSERNISINWMLLYDSRDNVFTPLDGIAAEIKVMLFDDAWGSDDTFQKYSGSVLYYRPLSDTLVLGLRGDGELVAGDAPFYTYPYVDIRGVKAMGYQGDMVLSSEVELRWSVTQRWALVGFGGAGKAYNNGSSADSDTIFSKGIGIRYLIASKLGLQFGLDVAQGPDDTAIYLQFGSSWSMK